MAAEVEHAVPLRQLCQDPDNPTASAIEITEQTRDSSTRHWEITLRLVLVLIATLYAIAASAIESVPKAVIADPPPDAKFPARMEVIHVPSGGVQINGVVYVASGERPHPAFVFFHGLPGNEKNLDLAQAVRRAGWTVVTVNYRGSWGSP